MASTNQPAAAVVADLKNLTLNDPSTSAGTSIAKTDTTTGPGTPITPISTAPPSTSAQSSNKKPALWADAPPPAGTALKVPLSVPTTGSKPAPAEPVDEKRMKMYDDLLVRVRTWTKVPKTIAGTPKQHHHANHGVGSTTTTATKTALPADGSNLDVLGDDDKMFLTQQCLFRYLRAVRYESVDEAARRLMLTLTWRREFGTPFSPDHISPENETGKQVVLGFDRLGRPVLYLNPSRQNTSDLSRQNQHLVYMLSTVIELMPAGQETLTLVINFKGVRAGGGVSVGQAREILNILQCHYPERLGVSLINDVPWFIKLFFDLISPFIDPRTRQKMIMRPKMTEYIPAEQLIADMGGSLEFTYDHAVYWPALAQLAEHRRQLFRCRWTQLGCRIGEDETQLHGADRDE